MKVSIIIPVWNGEKYLAEAIQSALDQDYPNKEILVIDDGSTDDTAKIIQSFGAKVIPLYQSNRGLGGTNRITIPRPACRMTRCIVMRRCP